MVLDCNFTSDGQPVGLRAQVTRAVGADLTVDVSTTARPVSADVLARAVTERSNQQLGSTDLTTTCAGDLPPTVGASTTCTVKLADQSRDLKVAVTAVDGGQIQWSADPA